MRQSATLGMNNKSAMLAPDISTYALVSIVCFCLHYSDVIWEALYPNPPATRLFVQNLCVTDVWMKIYTFYLTDVTNVFQICPWVVMLDNDCVFILICYMFSTVNSLSIYLHLFKLHYLFILILKNIGKGNKYAEKLQCKYPAYE